MRVSKNFAFLMRYWPRLQFYHSIILLFITVYRVFTPTVSIKSAKNSFGIFIRHDSRCASVPSIENNGKIVSNMCVCHVMLEEKAFQIRLRRRRRSKNDMTRYTHRIRVSVVSPCVSVSSCTAISWPSFRRPLSLECNSKVGLMPTEVLIGCSSQ